jgi:aspartate-semialdehyde dehydrogenase
MPAIIDRKIIIVGATGRVGREMLSILYERGGHHNSVSCAASANSKGKFLQYGSTNIVVNDLRDIDFSKYDIALFSAGSSVSSEYAVVAASEKCIVIDNTSYFRMMDDVSLIIPEVNFIDYQRSKNKYIIANPNCSTIQMVMVLKPLHDLFGLSEVVISTYQSVSGAGQNGVNELERQMLDSHDKPSCFSKRIVGNVLPQIGRVNDSGYTNEEEKMMNETQKILGIKLKITATCVRVPVFVGHSISVVATFKNNVNLDNAIDAINRFPGVRIVDNATPVECANKDDVFVSRIRVHPDDRDTLSFWCASDNLRKGAALNSVQIAEMI